jgi:hypothetical protein
VTQQVLNQLLAQFTPSLSVMHGLIFKTHGVLDRSRLTVGEEFRSCADDVRKRLFGNQGIDKAAAKRLGCALKRMQRDAAADFGLFKLHDSRLGHAETAAKLRRRHAEGIPDRAEPTLGRAWVVLQRA